MTITLTPELEAALAEEAKRLGKTTQELAIEKLRTGLTIQAGGDPEQKRLHKALEQLLLLADNVSAVTPRPRNGKGLFEGIVADKFRKQGFDL